MGTKYSTIKQANYFLRDSSLQVQSQEAKMARMREEMIKVEKNITMAITN